ncbi:hypothetical protein BE909_002520 [Escherichia coli]|nr:hypothetical protein [Escherichia coli]EFI1827859.1 hypothetical protein [Escherichia coli]EFI6731547.1 hypothetical protein [Escherichia coli]
MRQDTRSKEYEDVTPDRNKKRLKPHQIEQLRYELKSLDIELDYSDPTQFKRAYELIKNWGKNEESIHPQT